MAAAFGRLCVETFLNFENEKDLEAAAFGRLCVETTIGAEAAQRAMRSRLRAAVC